MSENRLDVYAQGKAWVEAELGRIDKAITRPKANSFTPAFTADFVAAKSGLGPTNLRHFLRGRGVTVEKWWAVRHALNRNVSGHYTYDDWAYEFGLKLRRLALGRFPSLDDAIEALDIRPSNLKLAIKGEFLDPVDLFALCHAFGVAMPEFRRIEEIDFLGHLDDGLTAPPLLEISIPRGLLRWSSTVDHIRIWLLLPKRNTPRALADAMGVPAGYVSHILLELERAGLVLGEDKHQDDFARIYERVPMRRGRLPQ